MTGCTIHAHGLSKQFGGDAATRTAPVEVLKGANLHLEGGTAAAVVGASGSGKSTLMQILGLLDAPTAGELSLNGQATAAWTPSQRAAWRNRNIGFVFQAHNLLPSYDALGNVMMPVRLAGGTVDLARARAEALLRGVGLGDRLTHMPTELSGGEQQRVAVARALVMAPSLILADEPTGNLDPATAEDVFGLLMGLHAQLGSTLVVVTHSTQLAARFSRQLTLVNGQVVDA